MPPLPPETAHVWAWFVDLLASRPPDQPLSYSEIAAWARLAGEDPAPWEVAALRTLDRAWAEDLRQR